MGTVLVAVLLAVVPLLALAFAVWASRPAPPPDDALALELAAELGAGRPILVVADRGQEWRIEVDIGEETFELHVCDHGARLRRPLRQSLDHGAMMLLAAKLYGREQEEYGFGRMLVPGEAGFEVGGRPGVALRGWETRLSDRLPEQMAELQVRWVRVELHWIETGRIGDVDAEWVRSAAAFLDEMATTIST